MPENAPTTQASDRRSFGRRIGSFSAATLVSRILGYVRDAMVAAYFGGGFQTDAFYAAFKIPNLLRRFLGEGALTAAFVPVFSEVLEKEGKDEARRFLHSLLSGLAIVLAGLVLLGIIFAEPLTKLMAWGFEGEKMALAVELTRLTFPFLLLVCLAAVVSAVLNASGRFFLPALAPSGLSVAEIAFIALFAAHMGSPLEGLAVSAVVGGLLHLVWQIPAMAREGYPMRFARPFAHPKVKTVFTLMVPTVIGLSADQINSFFDQLCASFLADGAITALYNSSRLMQMPLALFGVAVSSVALPALSRAAAAGRNDEYKDLVAFSIRIANYLLIPSFIGLAVLGFPIVRLLFERGRFTTDNAWMTYQALWAISAGLPAYSAAKILATAFYAIQDTKTPLKVAFWDMGLNIVLNIILMRPFGVAGLAMASAIAAWVQAGWLFWLLRGRVGRMDGRKILRSFGFGAAAGLAMGGVCGGLAFFVLDGAPLLVRVFVPMAAGGAFYFLASKALGIEEYGFLRDLLSKRSLPS